jgi:hypothetical protein
MLIDDSWARTWGDEVDESWKLHVALWAVQRSPDVLAVVRKFPPHAVVRRPAPKNWALATDSDLEKVPFPGTLGVVSSYVPGQVYVKQHPRDAAGAWVPVEELELARPWAGLSSDYLQAVLAMHRLQQETQKRQHAQVLRGATSRLHQRCARPRGVARAEAARLQESPGAARAGRRVRRLPAEAGLAKPRAASARRTRT